MDRALRPSRLEIEKVSEESAKLYTHWEKCFKNYIGTLTDADTEDKKLMVLVNNISVDNFNIIANCETYTSALEALRKHFIKPCNIIFSRHKLATRRQANDETLDEYVSVLHQLSRQCELKPVTAEVYRQELVRDAFVSGIRSSSIRQKLLEASVVELDKIVGLAQILEEAQRSSDSYSTGLSVMSTSAAVQDGAICAAAPSSNNQYQSDRQCSSCGGRPHRDRRNCPALNSTCHRCNKVGHWKPMCYANISSGSTRGASNRSNHRGNNTRNRAAGMYQIDEQNVSGENTQNFTYNDHEQFYSSTNFLMSLSADTKETPTKVIINGVALEGLVDTGSRKSYIHPAVASHLHLNIIPQVGEVALANGKIEKTPGYTIVNLTCAGNNYNKVVLVVLPNAISDVILGYDFQSRHSEVIFKYGGSRPPLVCALGTLNVEPPPLFSNLMPNCHPIAAKSRRYSYEDREFIKGEVTRLLREGIIRKSKSPWRAQVVVTGGGNQKKRLAIDYSETINKYTLLDAYPLPRIDDTVNKIAQFKVYSTIDLKSAYHQVPIREEDVPFTAFEADGGLYEFVRLPFGVTNGVALFQREMDRFVETNSLDGVIPYMDNVTICGRDQSHHDQNLNKFVEAAKKYNLTYNKSKCTFSTTKLAILGYIVENGVLRPDPERLKPLLNLTPPVDMKSLKRVMGFFAYYSKWICDFSNKIKVLKEVNQFPLSEKSLEAFQSLKNEVARSVVGAIDESASFTVETDASDGALAATLNQAGRPVAFFSRTLKASEMNQASVEKEAQAIVEAVRYWRHYLTGRHFKLVTDQRSVAFMFNSNPKGKIKNEKMLRWRMELSCYDYDIIYRPGSENVPPDTLSRNYCSAVSYPKLSDLHVSLCHPGVTRMCHFIKVRNLPYSVDDVKTMTRNCKICAECKPQFYSPPQAHLIKATQPFERLNIDFKGPLPSNDKNIYFLQIIDEFSKYPFVYPCSNLTAGTIIKSLSDLFSLFGMPAFIHSDRGPSLMSKELKDFLTSKGISTSRTTPYNPQGNGLVEKSNGTIWRAITMDLKSKGWPLSLWQIVLPNVLHSIRSLLCTSTNMTPHERLLGFPRRSGTGTSLPTWLSSPGPVLLRRWVRRSKQEPLVDEVELLEANIQYAHIRHADGREDTVSIKDLAPPGKVSNGSSVTGDPDENSQGHEVISKNTGTNLETPQNNTRIDSLIGDAPLVDSLESRPEASHAHDTESQQSSESVSPAPSTGGVGEEGPVLRRSSRAHRPPLRYQDYVKP